jgi:hypothetical protein
MSHWGFPNILRDLLLRRALVCELLQRVYLELRCFSVLFDVLDDLQSHGGVHSHVLDLHHPTERSLAERRQDFVSILENVAGVVDQVTVCIVSHGRRSLHWRSGTCIALIPLLSFMLLVVIVSGIVVVTMLCSVSARFSLRFWRSPSVVGFGLATTG